MQFLKRLFTDDMKIYLYLLGYSILILFFISPDSYTHDLFYRCDSAFFFTCGKAWMSGMVPYVDFADSKGPLLWLIYGLGYFISHYDYVGVFWLSCFFYSVTFFFCFKIGKLFLQETNKSLIVALLMAFPFFNCLIHYEIRAEDFCQPFICGSFYFMLKQLIYPENYCRKSSFYLGVSIMVCLLIKWNIVMYLFLVIAVYFFLLWKKRNLVSGVLWTFCGMLLVATPFIIYFLIEDNFTNFIEEYFMNTFRTVKAPRGHHTLRDYVGTPPFLLLYSLNVLYLVCSFFIMKFYKRLWYWPFLCCLYVMLLITYRFNWYYFQIVSVFGIFAVLIFIKITLKITHLKKTYSILGIFIVSVTIPFIIVLTAYTYKIRNNQNNLFFQQRNRKEYYETAYIINQIKFPKILFSSYDYGIGVPCGALPACKYWALQNGATQEMKELRHNAVINKKPDFIIVRESDIEFQKFIKENGYQYYSKCCGAFNDQYSFLYGRPGLKVTHKEIEPSNLDILFKRRIIK